MRTIIVEDSAATLAALEQALAEIASIHVIGTAATEDAAVELILAQQPDLVLLDLGLASGSGLGVLRRARAAHSAARIVVLTNRDEAAYRQACLAAGANAYFDKSRDHAGLLQQLHAWLPPTPENEVRRLQALRALGILDSSPEAAFDTLTELAARILNVPIALISLVDERRQWFKARHGLAATETSRAVSFCAHALGGSELLVVEDAHRDPRFADNPLVVGEPRVCFYAGAPLCLPGGEVLGTLCVIDHVPRQLDPTHRMVLQVLARHAVVEFELRRQVDDLIAEMEHRRQAEHRYMQLATRDPLTGLPNRAALLDRLQLAVRAAARTGDGLAFLFLDLDRFKYINDTLGHAAGDELLQTVANRLRHSVREVDTVARLGGDEFAIMLLGVHDAQTASRVAEKLLASLEAPVVLGNESLHVGASLGIALYPGQGDNPDALMRHADLAMYQAKRDGACGYRLYEPAFDVAARSQLTLEQDLRQALPRGELVLYYQPQVDLIRGTLTGIEALVRWQHPQQGLVPPGRFISLAEDIGLIGDIGDWVLHEATRELACLRAAGFSVPRVSVNVSALQLQPQLFTRVSGSLRDAGLAPADLELEITETAITADGPVVLELLGSLRALGVGVAVDDFGVGYSSLAMLRRLPVSTLKIDRAFIRELTCSRQDATIVRAIIDLAQGLELRLVAEGIEEREQQLILGSLGCPEAQGYLFSRPLPAPELMTWMRDRAETMAACGGDGCAQESTVSGHVPGIPAHVLAPVVV